MSFQATIEHFKLFVKRNEPSSPDDAMKSCLQGVRGISLPYVVYRWMQFLIHFMIALGSFLDYHRTWPPSNEAPQLLEEHGPTFYAKWLLYLTHWGCCLNMLQSLTGAIVLSTAYANRSSPGGRDTVFGVSRRTAELYCNLYRIALVYSVYITCGFWLLVWNPEIFAADLVLTTEHGVGMAFMLLDLFVVQFPYTMKTGLHVFWIVAAYIFLTLVHHWTGSLDRYQSNTYLYEVQDWNRPWPTIFQNLGSICSLEALHLTLWGLYQARRKLIETRNQ